MGRRRGAAAPVSKKLSVLTTRAVYAQSPSRFTILFGNCLRRGPAAIVPVRRKLLSALGLVSAQPLSTLGPLIVYNSVCRQLVCIPLPRSMLHLRRKARSCLRLVPRNARKPSRWTSSSSSSSPSALSSIIIIISFSITYGMSIGSQQYFLQEFLCWRFLCRTCVRLQWLPIGCLLTGDEIPSKPASAGVSAVRFALDFIWFVALGLSIGLHRGFRTQVPLPTCIL